MSALGLILCAAALAAPVAQVHLDQKKVLTREAARGIAAATIKAAAADGYKITVTICDDGGHLIYLERMDDANPSSVETSTDKAVGAVLYKQPTKNYADRLAAGETFVLRLRGVMPVSGGFPLVVEGKVVGGVGVGGAPKSEFDAKIAQAGVDWLMQNVSPR